MLRFLSLSLLLLYLCLTHYCLAQRYTLPYDNVPITASSWEEVDIAWPNIFNSNIPNTAKLLRPINYAHQHGLVMGAHINMKLGELGVSNAVITITAVRHLSQQTVDQIHRLQQGEKPIIGVYVHQTNDVRTYHFKDKQGKISTIDATPVHPFYVKNLQAYLPISQVTDNMQLVGKKNEAIHLICPRNKHQKCGLPYHKGKIIPVYNIEVYQRHFYRVGHDAIKVHNPTGAGCGAPVEDLINHLEQKLKSGERRIGVMIVDEISSQIYPETHAQYKILNFAQKNNLPVIAIEVNTKIPQDAMSFPGIKTREEMLPFVHKIVYKAKFNGFDTQLSSPDLRHTLRSMNLLPEQSDLVIMGYSCNTCVRLTAVGGKVRPNGIFTEGATQLGYGVLTSEDIVRGDPANKIIRWKNEPGVTFFGNNG